VYFAHCEQAEAVKIGKARDVKSRLSMLQIGNPTSLELVEMIEDNSGKLEGLLHRWFRGKRIRGEWFRITPDDVRELVAKIKEHGTAFLDVKYSKTSTQKPVPRPRPHKPPGRWTEIIREEFKRDGRSQRAVAAAAGLTNAQLSRFLAGKRDLTMDCAGRLMNALGLMVIDPRSV
jgi:antitoxin component HigA of HigAB toxin-antitoxin module